MDARRRTLVFAAGAVALTLLLLASVPYLFRDRIAARVQTEISDRIDANVRWQAVGLSFLRDFPNATLRLDDLSVIGRDRFDGDTLAHVPSVRLMVELPSVLRSARGTGPLIVRSIEIDRPSVHLRVLEDGTSNWDLLPERDGEVAASSNPFALNLRRFEVRGGSVAVENRQTGLAASMSGLQQSLSGDFRQTRFQVRSRTESDAVSVRFAGVPYLSQVRLAMETELDVDTDMGQILLSETAIRLNDLRLDLSGSVGMSEDSVLLDLAFKTPGTAFQEILSLVPTLYMQPGFSDLRTSGTMTVTGSVRGGYGEHAFPAFALAAKVNDGQFQYPELPLPARDVFLDATLTNPGGDLDSTVVRLERFRVTIGNDAIEGAFAMRTPVSDPAIDLQVKGNLDLADLARTVQLQGAHEMMGSVAADASVQARWSDIDLGQYDRVAAEGNIRASQLVLRTEGLPHAIQIDESLLLLSPRHAELVSFRGRIGNSDLTMTGRLDNLLGFAFRDEVLRGEARVASAYFDLDEWSSDDELQAITVPRNLDFAMEAEVQRLTFSDIDIRNASGSLRIREERATLEDFRVEMLGGTMAVNGFYETTDVTRPTFDVGLAIAGVDLAEAATEMVTFRVLAPIVRYAQGRVSSDLRLSGTLGADMTPVYDMLSGRGSFETANLAVTGFPLMDRLAELLKTEQLRNPTLSDIRSSFQIRDGRLHVNPFDVRLGQFTTTVAGSNGIDETLDYSLDLQLPRALLGAEANQAIATLASRAGRVGINWETADVITLGVQVGGTVGRPVLSTDGRGATATALQDAGSAVRSEVDRRVEEGGERVDAEVAEARRRAAEETDRILAEAEQHAARLRAEARPLAQVIRNEGYAKADALLAQANSPVARLAAQAGADRLRSAADAEADRILNEADARADALLETARNRADSIPN